MRDKGKKITVTLRIEEETLAVIEEIGKAQQRDRSNMIRVILTEWVAEQVKENRL